MEIYFCTSSFKQLLAMIINSQWEGITVLRVGSIQQVMTVDWRLHAQVGRCHGGILGQIVLRLKHSVIFARLVPYVISTI